MKEYFAQKAAKALMLFAAAGVLMGAGSLPALAADQDIVILFTNDVHCGVNDNIGYAGVSLYEKEMRKETPYVTLVDAGDAVQGAPLGTLSQGEDIVRIMNGLGYDFAIPGNHEFDYEMPQFLNLAEQLDCGYYSANFTGADGSLVFEPYKMFQYGDTKLAMVGVTTPESFTKSTPAYFQDENGNYIYGFREDETGEALYSAVQQAVDSARAEGAEFVILVGHLGMNYVTEQWSSTAVLANTTGIDAMIDGHSHEAYTTTVKNKNGEEVLLAQTGTKLQNLGKLVLTPEDTFQAELIFEIPAADDLAGSYTVQPGDSLSRIAKEQLGRESAWAELYNLNRSRIKNPDRIRPGLVLTLPGASVVNEAGRNVDPAAQGLIDSIEAQFSETLKTPIGRTDVTLTVNDPDTGLRAVRNAETNLGDLTADAYRAVTGADVAFSNGGGIRADIPAGEITYNDALSVFPFGNSVCMVEATGQQILDALEMGARDLPGESGGFQQVSGMKLTIDTRKPSGVELDGKGNFIRVNGDYRVQDVTVGGEPLDLSRTYKVASHNYMLLSGGDGMTMFTGCNVLMKDVSTDVDALYTYINQNLQGVVGADYGNPRGQGRITILK